MSETGELLKITFDIPTYNAAEHLETCIRSILNQGYSKDMIEILIADGDSEDDTVDIARKYGARILRNSRRLGDYGAKINAAAATGDLFVIFAADNELATRNWVDKVSTIFARHPEVSTVWGPMKSGSSDRPINRYYELIQSDPLMFLINRNLEYYVHKDAQKYDIDGVPYYIFKVKRHKPLVWGANGLTYRFKLVKDIILREEFLGDNDVFQILVESGNNVVAYMPSLVTYHHHVRSLRQWVSKWKRNYEKHLISAFETRNLNWAVTEHFTIRVILWFIYAIIPIFSTLHALYKMVKDRNKYWLFHPIVTLAQALTLGSLILTRKKGLEAVFKLLSKSKSAYQIPSGTEKVSNLN